MAPGNEKDAENSIRLKAQLDAEAATTLDHRGIEAANTKWARDKEAAQEAARNDVDQVFLQAVLDASKASIDRSRSAAQFVQQAAAAIVTLYAGMLAVSFTATGRLLPFRGVVPAFFLGLSIATATVYVAFLTKPTLSAVRPPATDFVTERVMWRLDTFSKLVGEVVDRRAFWLRASVVALAFGVLFLPAPFVAFSTNPPPDLTAYPWPTPPAVSDVANASIDSVLYTAQVAEIAAARQRAQAAQNLTADLGLWAALSAIGLVALLVASTYKMPKKSDAMAADPNYSPPPQSGRGGTVSLGDFVWPAIVILIGFYLLLLNFGLLSWPRGDILWPIVPILLGVFLIFRRGR